MTDSTTPEPWAQREGEPARAYERFLTWLHLNGARTNTAAAELCGCSEGTIRAHATAWNWKERAQAWDKQRLPKLSDRLREVVDDDRRAALRSFRDSQIKQADAMSALALQVLELCDRSLKKAGDDNSVADLRGAQFKGTICPDGTETDTGCPHARFTDGTD